MNIKYSISESRFPKIKSDSRVGYCFESDQPDSSWFISFESNCKSAVLNCGDDLNCAYQHMQSYENNHCKGTSQVSVGDVMLINMYNMSPTFAFLVLFDDSSDIYFRWNAV